MNVRTHWPRWLCEKIRMRSAGVRWSWMANNESYALMGGAVSAVIHCASGCSPVCISSILTCFVRFLPGANHLLSMPTYMKFKAVNGCSAIHWPATGRMSGRPPVMRPHNRRLMKDYSVLQTENDLGKLRRYLSDFPF